MPPSSRTETIAVGGDAFDAYCSLPASGRGPGLLLFQEIFGVNDNMRTLADRLAAAGFVTLVPDMFWRLQRNFQCQGEGCMAESMALSQRFDAETAVVDIAAAHRHLLAMAACDGRVGVMGFCLGGGLAFLAATTSRVDGRGPDVAVCYYGSAIHGLLGQVDELQCPALFHYGEQDPYIPAEQIADVERAVAGRPGTELHRYQAGHAFSNWDMPSLHQEQAAALAWSRTVEFLDHHLG